jgi:hypothetical protein
MGRKNNSLFNLNLQRVLLFRITYKYTQYYEMRNLEAIVVREIYNATNLTADTLPLAGKNLSVNDLI